MRGQAGRLSGDTIPISAVLFTPAGPKAGEHGSYWGWRSTGWGREFASVLCRLRRGEEAEELPGRLAAVGGGRRADAVSVGRGLDGASEWVCGVARTSLATRLASPRRTVRMTMSSRAVAGSCSWSNEMQIPPG